MDTLLSEVLEALKGIVTVMRVGIGKDSKGGDNPADKNSKNIDLPMITEKSGEALMQLYRWQLVVGFHLRDLEVRNKLLSLVGKDVVNGGGFDENAAVTWMKCSLVWVCWNEYC
jgi:hypothetical protein